MRSLRVECLLAEAERADGADAAAIARWRGVVERADALEASHAAWIARWKLGEAALEQGQVEQAVTLLDDAVRRIESMRAGLEPLGEGLRFLRDRADTYVDLAGGTEPPLGAFR